jgi:rubrerythrin
MTDGQDTYMKGEPVPFKGTYRCTGCGEVWTTQETGVRFPPCDANKSGESKWVLVSRGD